MPFDIGEKAPNVHWAVTSLPPGNDKWHMTNRRGLIQTMILI